MANVDERRLTSAQQRARQSRWLKILGLLAIAVGIAGYILGDFFRV